jgi:hypothetical protein
MPASNPFEPPRTADLDGDGGDTTQALPVPAEALEQLIGGATWVRWSARMLSASIAVGLIIAVVDFLRTDIALMKMATLLSVAIGTAVYTIILVLLRRYAAASDSLRAGTESAGRVIDAQASLLRLLGVLTIVSLALMVLGAAVGYTLGRLR